MTLYRFGPLVLVGLVLAPAAPRTVYAQDVKVKVKLKISSEVAREVERALEEGLPAVGPDLGLALSDLTTGLLDRSVELARDNTSNRPAQQTDRQTRTLNLGTAGDLDLSTLAGDITVNAGTGGGTLEIIRQAHASTDADAKAALDRVSVDVEEHAGRVRVHTDYSLNLNRSHADVEVSYVVTAPAGTRVTAHSVAGDISVTGIHGEVSVNATSGSVTLSNVRNVTEAHSIAGPVTITDAIADHDLSIETIAGNVVLTRVKAPHVGASTISGQIQGEDLSCDSALLKTLSGNIAFRGSLAHDGRYELHTQSGAVHFEPTGSMGFDLDAHTFSGVVHVDPALHLQPVGSQRRSLSGTVGNGGATVTIVTFSGNVTIGRS